MDRIRQALRQARAEGEGWDVAPTQGLVYHEGAAAESRRSSMHFSLIILLLNRIYFYLCAWWCPVAEPCGRPWEGEVRLGDVALSMAGAASHGIQWCISQPLLDTRRLAQA